MLSGQGAVTGGSTGGVGKAAEAIGAAASPAPPHADRRLSKSWLAFHNAQETPGGGGCNRSTIAWQRRARLSGQLVRGWQHENTCQNRESLLHSQSAINATGCLSTTLISLSEEATLARWLFCFWPAGEWSAYCLPIICPHGLNSFVPANG